MRVISDGAAVSVVADARNFSGRVWRTTYLPPSDDEKLVGFRFSYEPGSRSYWHVHEREQVIVAVHGRGLVAWEQLEAPIALSPGDWWHVQPGIAHWHGATPDAPFAHLAIAAGGATTWLHEVSEQEYRGR